MTIFVVINVVLIWMALGYLSYRETTFESRVISMEEKRERLYRELTDPEKIEADFERSARLREMKDANRTTLPREGAGPPAKVYRPSLRAKKVGNWRPNRIN